MSLFDSSQTLFLSLTWQDALAHLNSLTLKGKKVPQRVWCKQFGLKSDRLMGMILNGQRLPSAAVLRGLIETQDFTHRQSRIIELLVERERLARKSKSTVGVERELSELRALIAKNLNIYPNMTPILARWYVTVIEILAMEPDFVDDPAALAEKLNHKVSVAEIIEALDALEQAGKIVRSKATETKPSIRRAPKKSHWRVEPPAPSRSIREYHRQMIARGIESIEEVPMNQRFITSLTFPTTPSEFIEATQYLNEFKEEFNTRFNRSEIGKSAVYQLNIQFFPHTQKV